MQYKKLQNASCVWYGCCPHVDHDLDAWPWPLCTSPPSCAPTRQVRGHHSPWPGDTGPIITLSPGLVFYRCGDLPSPGNSRDMDLMDMMETLNPRPSTGSMTNPWNLTSPGHTSNLFILSSSPGLAPLCSGDFVSSDIDRLDLENAPTRAFFWLKAPTIARTFRKRLRQYAK